MTFPIYGKIKKNVPSHQPDDDSLLDLWEYSIIRQTPMKLRIKNFVCNI
jgi:hypothetical protein